MRSGGGQKPATVNGAQLGPCLAGPPFLSRPVFQALMVPAVSFRAVPQARASIGIAGNFSQPDDRTSTAARRMKGTDWN